MRIAIVGAGLVGLNAAHALLDEGHAVTMIEPGAPQGRPSDGNAGWIAHTDILPLASPKMWRNLPRWLTDPLGPLAIRPAYLPTILPWLLRFLRSASPGAVAASTDAIAALNLAALPAWRARLEKLGGLDYLTERGCFTIFAHPGALRAAEPMFAKQEALGIAFERLDAAELRRREPALGPAVIGGAFYPAGARVSDPADVTRFLANTARRRGAVWHEARTLDFRAGEAGITVVTETGPCEADRVVLATGAWSGQLAAKAGSKIPIDTERGYNATFPKGTLGLSEQVLFEGLGFVTTPLATGDRVGGAVEFAGFDAPPDHRRTDAILTRLAGMLPDFRPDKAEGRRWMGFRPSLPDSLPVIGPAPGLPRHLIFAFGHGHYGLTQSALTGDLVADLVAGRPPRIDLRPFRADRF